MDLHTGRSLWAVLSEPPAFPALTTDESCEVAIVGAGITGALMARELAARGIATVVVDRREACMGSTVACTALVQYEIDRTLIELAGLLGHDHAAAAYRACRRTLDDFARLAGDVADCDLLKRPSLFLAKHASDVKKLEEEAVARRGLEIDVTFLSASALRESFNINRPAALLSDVAYVVDPMKLTAGLLRVAAKDGARIYAGAPVEIDSDTAAGYVLRAPGGTVVRCKHVVIASGYETPEQFTAIRSLCELRSTYALATSPVQGSEPWPASALLWEMGDPYSYARITGENRVVMGGEDENFVDAKARDALLPMKLERLRANLRELAPSLDAVPEFCWAGTFAQTADGLPYIGVHPSYPRCYFALGYGGNGITFSVLASRIIADQIEGISNEDAKLFGFERTTSRSA